MAGRAAAAIGPDRPLVAWLVFLAGAGVRLEQLLANRSLWLNEALLVNNVVQRDYVELLEPLAGDQGAPVLFLWLERTAVIAGGNNELALRMIPFLAGLALMPVVYEIGRRLVSPLTGTVAVALVAFSPAAIRYSTEVKQYSTDAFLCALVVLLALVWLDRRSGWSLLVLGFVGVVGVWLSHPLILVLAGVGILLAGHATVRREGRTMVTLGAMGAAWAISVGLSYVATLRELGASDILTAYWRGKGGFPDEGSSIIDRLAWVPGALSRLVADPAHLRWPAAVAAVAAIGVWSVTRSSGVSRVVLVLVSFAVAFGAALAEAYPVSGRLAVFLLPLGLVVMASSVRRERIALVSVPLLLVATSPWWRETGRVIVDPLEIAESRPVMAYVAEHRQPGDRVYVHDPTIAPYLYYGPIVGLTADGRTEWFDAATCEDLPSPHQPLRESVAGAERVWVVFAFTFTSRPADEAELVRQQFDGIGERVDVHSAHDAFAALYLVGPVADGVAPRPGTRPDADRPDLACLGVRPLDPSPRSHLPSGPLGTGHRT